MRRVFRGAVPLLAAALGFARPASAQLADPVSPDDPAAAVSVESDADAPPDRHVVPHRRVVLEPMKESSDDPTAKGARPGVDLVAPPGLPQGLWTQSPTPRVPVAPSGLPGGAVAGVSAPPRPVVLEPMPATPRAPIVSATPPRVWPAAFLVGKDSEPAEATPAAHGEAADDLTAPPWESAKAPATADVKRRVEAVSGRQVMGVSALTQADGVIIVRVRVRSRGQDPDRGKIVELPQAPGSGVRVLLEVGR